MVKIQPASLKLQVPADRGSGRTKTLMLKEMVHIQLYQGAGSITGNDVGFVVLPKDTSTNITGA